MRAQNFFVGLCLLFLVPVAASAQVIFTEIMYNPPGTDTGREWAEVYNDGAGAIDLTTYKLFENAVNHKIAAYSGANILEAGQRAVIADNPEKFLADFSNFISGTTAPIFDSAFSLNNTGEELKLINSAGAVEDAVTYSAELGGNDTGNSLQLNDSVWIPVPPTPGEINATEAADESSDDSEDGADDSDNDSGSSTETGSGSSHESQTDLSNYKPTIKLKISAGRERLASVNSPIKLELIHNQEENTKVKARWSMGDGHEVGGRKISYIFDRAGEYNIVVNAKFRKDLAVARTKIYVSDPDVKVELSDSGKGVDLLLKNNDGKEVNIGGYEIKQGGKSFVMADDTILSSGQILALSQATTGLIHDESITIYFPNGDKMWNF
ncbi:MAG TPA: lamin tail domain-containing protein [Candidatus Paceibacterota bacterium]|nr:lamin tail domain-containing protein [Candidatus Paceibacterota bacterium]HRZ34724.1 lamin tail domain-containing protein [Candidatus Paceibacterota bacterium]